MLESGAKASKSGLKTEAVFSGPLHRVERWVARAIGEHASAGAVWIGTSGYTAIQRR